MLPPFIIFFVCIIVFFNIKRNFKENNLIQIDSIKMFVPEGQLSME